MLDSIRKSKNSLLILLVFGAIIVVFVFWGIGPTGGGGKADVVAYVNDEAITIDDYLTTYRNEFEYYKRNFQGDFTEEMAEEMGLKQRALDITINRTLVVQEAKDEGVKVTREEVQSAIMSMPAFQKNGVFDKETYFGVLKSNRLKPGDFEQSVRLDLMTAKMRQKIIDDLTVTPDEVADAYLAENREVRLDYAEVGSDRYVGEVEVTEEEARKYHELNAEEFMVPTKVDVFYAWVDLEDIASGIEVTDAEIKDYYESNQARFETRPEVKASHILVRAPAGDESAREEARKEAEGLLERLEAGESFAELAREHSDDPGSARKGGDLGWFARGIMVEEFEDAAFSLDPGQTSGVVETGFGYHVIRVEDARPAGVKPLRDVSGEIRKIVSWQKAQDEAEALLGGVESAMREASTVEELKEAASGEGIKSGSTGLVREGDESVGIFAEQRLTDTVFTMREGDVTGPVGVEDRVYVMKLVTRETSHVPTYDRIAEEVNSRVREKKAAEEAMAVADEILDKASAGGDLAKAAAEQGIKVGTTGYFSRADGLVPGLGLFVADRPGLFSLTAEAPLYNEVVGGDGSFYVFSLDDAREADLEGLGEVRDQLRQRLMAEKQDRAMSEWLERLRKESEIKYYPDKL